MNLSNITDKQLLDLLLFDSLPKDQAIQYAILQGSTEKELLEKLGNKEQYCTVCLLRAFD